MNKFFTQCLTGKDQLNNMKRTGKRTFGPREETIGLICQFARVYRIEPKLKQGLCAYILN
jgi:hypothetical protein